MSQDVFKVYHNQQKQNKNNTNPNSTTIDQTYQELSLTNINDTKKQLDEMIEHLDQKIKKRIEMNQSNFLLAYKMHLAKVSKQLKNLKEQSESDDRILTADHAISNLIKQTSFFRQEAIRLQSLLQDALDELEVYKRKSELLEKDLSKSNDTIKRLTLQNKKFQVSNVTLTQQLTAQTIFSRETGQVVLQAKEKDQVKILKSFNQKLVQKIPTENIRSYSKQKQQAKGTNVQIPDLKIISIENLQNNLQNSTNLYKKSFRSDRSEQRNGNQNESKLSHDFLLKKHPQKSQKLKDAQKKRYRTQSTFDYRNKSNFTNSNIHFDFGQTYEQKIKANCGANQQARNELNIFKNLINYFNKARQFNKTQTENPKIHSLTLNDFIFNDKDILQFCTYIFPNLEIKQKTNQFGISFEAETKQKSKTLAHLSAELMKKFKIKNSTFHTEQSHLSSSNLLEDNHLHLSPTQKYKVLLANGLTTPRDKIIQKRKDTKEIKNSIKRQSQSPCQRSFKREPQSPCQRTWNSFYLTSKKDKVFIEN